MVTVDRSPHTNYLAATLTELHHSSPEMYLTLMDSGPRETSGEWVLDTILPWQDWIFELHRAKTHICANLNVAHALRCGAERGDWVLFLEDDIAVCKNFLGSVKSWLGIYGTADYPLCVFGSTYSKRQPGAHNIPISGFYGTQAVALRSEDAENLAS